MLTLSIAQFFIDIAGKTAVLGGVPAGAVQDSLQRTTIGGRAFRLLPGRLQRRIRQRQSATLRRLALVRLAETSPHLLADIGVVPNEIATFDGRHTQDRNVALTTLILQPLLMPASGLVVARGHR